MSKKTSGELVSVDTSNPVKVGGQTSFLRIQQPEIDQDIINMVAPVVNSPNDLIELREQARQRNEVRGRSKSAFDVSRKSAGQTFAVNWNKQSNPKLINNPSGFVTQKDSESTKLATTFNEASGFVRKVSDLQKLNQYS